MLNARGQVGAGKRWAAVTLKMQTEDVAEYCRFHGFPAAAADDDADAVVDYSYSCCISRAFVGTILLPPIVFPAAVSYVAQLLVENGRISLSSSNGIIHVLSVICNDCLNEHRLLPQSVSRASRSIRISARKTD